MIFFGIILGLICCEFILQAGSFLIKDKSNNANFKKLGSIRILCAGDSHTYGLGAPKGKSYPDFLRSYLDASAGGKFEVVNLGKPGLNTAMLARRLNEVMEVFRPDMLIVMTGANDNWNLNGLFERHDKSFSGILPRVIEKTKFYKLMRIIWFNLSNGFDKKYFRLAGLPRDLMNLPELKGLDKEDIIRLVSFSILLTHADYYRYIGDYDKAIDLLFYARGLEVCNYLVYEQLSEVLIEMSDYLAGVSVCIAWRKYFPLDVEINLRLGALFKALRAYEKSRFYFNLALKKEPDNIEAKKGVENSDYFLSMDLTCNVNAPVGQFSLAEIAYKDAFIYSENNGHIKLSWNGENLDFGETDYAQFMALRVLIDNLDVGLSALKQKEYFNSLYLRKVQEICELARRKRVPLILMGYPAQIFDYVKLAANQYDVPFLDLRGYFNAKVDKHNRREFFLPDGHCTALGYEIIGKAVAEEILNSNHTCTP